MAVSSGAPDGAAAVVAAAASRAGPAREHNQDSHRIDPAAAVFLVADGMGGHPAGEVASAIAAARVHEWWTGEGAGAHIAAYAARPQAAERRALFRALREGLVRAHLHIAEEASGDEGKHGMGTTLTGFAVAGGDAIFAHAGDSRAYLVRDGRAIQLSEDHNIQNRLRAAGTEPAADERWRGVLTSALGVGDPRIATFAVPLVAGDRFVLCTDGVYPHLAGEAELVSVAGGAAGPALAAAALVELPRARGGGDDATAVVVDVVRAGAGPAWPAVSADERARDWAAVSRCALLEAMTAQERLRALRITTRRRLGAGELIAGAAGGDRAAHVLLDGDATSHSGERLLPGGLIDAGALIEGTGPARDALATSPCRLLAIRRGDFIELTEEEPDLGVKLYAALARLMAG